MYCDINDIIQAVPETDLIELTDDDSSGSYDSTLLNSVIQEQSDYIDGYLRGRYEVPITDNPILKQLCIILTAYKLTYRRMKYRMPESMVKSKENAEKKLLMIQKGEITLDSGSAETRSPHISSNTRTQIFTDELLDQFI